jgi:hypothetical protein
VTVSGSGFQTNLNDPVTVTLKCVPGARTGGKVAATTFTQLRSATKDDAYEYKNPKPTVNHLAPSSGSTAGNTSVTIYGTGFLTSAVVTFEKSDYQCQDVVLAQDANSLTCNTPPHPAGKVPVVVTVDCQASDNDTTYTYVDVGTLYWTNSANISPSVSPKCPTSAQPTNGGSIASGSSLGTGEPNQCLVVTDKDGTTSGVAADNKYIYWANLGEGFIGRASAAGKDSVQSWADLSKTATVMGPHDVVVQGEYLYWSDPGKNHHSISRIKIAGDTAEIDAKWKVDTGSDGPLTRLLMKRTFIGLIRRINE